MLPGRGTVVTGKRPDRSKLFFGGLRLSIPIYMIEPQDQRGHLMITAGPGTGMDYVAAMTPDTSLQPLSWMSTFGPTFNWSRAIDMNVYMEYHTWALQMMSMEKLAFLPITAIKVVYALSAAMVASDSEGATGSSLYSACELQKRLLDRCNAPRGSDTAEEVLIRLLWHGNATATLKAVTTSPASWLMSHSLARMFSGVHVTFDQATVFDETRSSGISGLNLELEYGLKFSRIATCNFTERGFQFDKLFIDSTLPPNCSAIYMRSIPVFARVSNKFRTIIINHTRTHILALFNGHTPSDLEKISFSEIYRSGVHELVEVHMPVLDKSKCRLTKLFGGEVDNGNVAAGICYTNFNLDPGQLESTAHVSHSSSSSSSSTESSTPIPNAPSKIRAIDQGILILYDLEQNEAHLVADIGKLALTVNRPASVALLKTPALLQKLSETYSLEQIPSTCRAEFISYFNATTTTTPAPKKPANLVKWTRLINEYVKYSETLRQKQQQQQQSKLPAKKQ